MERERGERKGGRERGERKGGREGQRGREGEREGRKEGRRRRVGERGRTVKRCNLNTQTVWTITFIGVLCLPRVQHLRDFLYLLKRKRSNTHMKRSFHCITVVM